jgi:hypothetical protein
MPKFKIEVKNNDRGFAIGEFKDLYDKDCSIQESSLATKAAIWLGCNEGTHVKDVGREEVCLARMHLDRKRARSLILLLQYFVDHGCLPVPKD